MSVTGDGIKMFEEGLRTLNLKLDSVKMQQFLDYYELLAEWNKVMNLTAITQFHDVVGKHFLDSLSIVKVIKPSSERLIDIGTGAGFPGIPLKIAFPELKVVLLDSLKKRICFLEEVIGRLRLNNVHAVHGRAEDYGRDLNYRDGFDLCVSRAVAKLQVLSEYCLPFVKKDGCFISYKSGNIKEELHQAENAVAKLGAAVDGICRFTLLGTDQERTLVVIKKIKPTADKFPRTAGKPEKDPL